MGLWDEEPTKRTLGSRERQILWHRAGKKCEACGKEIGLDEMQSGHKFAASKGGSATLRNSVCLCYRCNKLQVTDTWVTFLKKVGKQPEGSKTKIILEGLNIRQLKFLAQKHNVKLKGRIEEGLFEDHRLPASKKQYINALTKILSDENISSELKQMSQQVKKKRRFSNSYW